MDLLVAVYIYAKIIIFEFSICIQLDLSLNHIFAIL